VPGEFIFSRSVFCNEKMGLNWGLVVGGPACCICTPDEICTRIFGSKRIQECTVDEILLGPTAVIPLLLLGPSAVGVRGSKLHFFSTVERDLSPSPLASDLLTTPTKRRSRHLEVMAQPAQPDPLAVGDYSCLVVLS
jgi:hypothetical protein